jgi:hypothetical protein
MAEGLAAFARNAMRRGNPNLAEATRQWEDDLSYLRRAFEMIGCHNHDRRPSCVGRDVAFQKS